MRPAALCEFSSREGQGGREDPPVVVKDEIRCAEPSSRTCMSLGTKWRS